MAFTETVSVTVGGSTYNLPPISFGGLQIGYQKIWSKNTGRSASGKMKGTIIRVVRSVKISYSFMSATNFQTILDAINTTTAFFTVSYKLPGTNTTKTGTFYASDVDTTVKGVNLGDGTYAGVSFELIEK